MKAPDLDRRSRRDVLEEMQKLAESYTPEWRFDQEHPDVGTALALIYSDMFARTIRLFNQSAQKNQTSFFNHLETGMHPATPAYGYLTFTLAGQMDHGVEVSRGTQAVAEGVEGDLIYETVNDLYVTPAQVEMVLDTDGAEDHISCVYQRETYELDPQPFPLFEAQGDNLQRHRLYFCHDSALKLERGALIELDWGDQLADPDWATLYQDALDPNTLVFYYYTGDGQWKELAQRAGQNGHILLDYPDGAEPFAPAELLGQEGYWICCEALEVPRLETLSLSRFSLRTQGSDLMPDVIHAAGTDQDQHSYLPFGERMGLSDAVYFGSEEVLCKRGAQVQLQFNMDFLRIPVEIDPQKPQIDWKMIMKRSDFQPDMEYDVTIEEVIWEYFNGQGWSRLFPDQRCSDIFTTRYGTVGQVKLMDFTCPQDMEHIIVNSHDTYFIRARILKINNLYKTKGYFITPMLSETLFSYQYPQAGVSPQQVAWENNLELEDWSSHPMPLNPFRRMEQQKRAVYFGWQIPPVGGPIKLFFQMKSTLSEISPDLAWEYWNGTGWRELNLVDETAGLTKSGLITMIGNPDFARCSLWGQELYWIRVTDRRNVYRREGRRKGYPLVTGLFPNTTRILNVRTREDALFSIEPHQENLRCQLPDRHLYQVEVWVCETGQLETRELERLERERRVQKETDGSGTVQQIWVRWDEVEDFVLTDSGSRCYRVDRNEGVIFFSDGVHGKIPAAQPEESIRVRYSTGGGQEGNQEAGAINRLNRNLPYISDVFNPEPTVGGSDQETADEAMARTASSFSHRFRAVTARDYENLARQAHRSVFRAKCFSGYDGKGRRSPGAVTLVLLQKDYFGSRKYFDLVQSQVLQFLTGKVSDSLMESGKLYVVEPQFLELRVKAEIHVESFDQIFQVRHDTELALAKFIDPIHGNFDGSGWPIGTIPNVTQLTNVMKSVANIRQIKSVSLSAYLLSSGGREEINLDHQDQYRFALPVSGTHDLYLTLG